MKKNLIPTSSRLTLLVTLLCLFLSVSETQAKKKKVLVFCKTAGFHHGSIKQGVVALFKLGAENKFDIDTTTNSANINGSNLKKYDAVIFLNTTGDILNEEQQNAFIKYIQSGKGFVGVHAATDCESKWPWYGNLVGAYFGGHPAQQVARLNVVDHNHLSTKNLPDTWSRKDEWYNFKWMAKDLKVLITIDEKSYDPGKEAMGENHPMAWYHEYDGGRAFYTGLGHTEDSYGEPMFLAHLLGGIKYALKQKK